MKNFFHAIRCMWLQIAFLCKDQYTDAQQGFICTKCGRGYPLERMAR